MESALRHFSGVLMHRFIARGHSLAASGSGTAWVEAVRTVLPEREPASGGDEGETA